MPGLNVQCRNFGGHDGPAKTSLSLGMHIVFGDMVFHAQVLRWLTYGTVIASRLTISSDVEALASRKILLLDDLEISDRYSSKLAFFLLKDLVAFQVSLEVYQSSTHTAFVPSIGLARSVAGATRYQEHTMQCA